MINHDIEKLINLIQTEEYDTDSIIDDVTEKCPSCSSNLISIFSHSSPFVQRISDYVEQQQCMYAFIGFFCQCFRYLCIYIIIILPCFSDLSSST